jgi:hypothetical protein
VPAVNGRGLGGSPPRWLPSWHLNGNVKKQRRIILLYVPDWNCD